MNTWRGIVADFRALWEKVNGPKWVPFLNSDRRVWFLTYSSSGAPKAEFVRYWFREPMDERLMIDGDLDAACERGVAKKRVASAHEVRSGLVDLYETL